RFDNPALTVAISLETPRRHFRPVFAIYRAILAMHGRRNPTRNLPIVPAILMNPFGVISGISEQRFRLDRNSRLVEQRPSHRFVVAWTPTHYEAGRQHGAAGHAQRQLHIPLTFSTSPGVKVGTGRRALDTRR